MHDACGYKAEYTGCKTAQTREVQEKTASSKRRDEPRFDGTRLPHMSSQSFQSHPPGPRDVLLSELPDKGPRDGFFCKNKRLVQIIILFLHRESMTFVRRWFVMNPGARSPDDRNDDVVCFVTLEGVDVEYRVLPCESCGLRAFSIALRWAS
jgi:hypothetical protein